MRNVNKSLYYFHAFILVIILFSASANGAEQKQSIETPPASKTAISERVKDFNLKELKNQIKYLKISSKYKQLSKEEMLFQKEEILSRIDSIIETAPQGSELKEEAINLRNLFELGPEIYSNTWFFLGFTVSTLLFLGKFEIARLRWENFQLSVFKTSFALLWSDDAPDRTNANIGFLGIGYKTHFATNFELGAITYPLSVGIHREGERLTFIHSTIYFRYNIGGFAMEAGADYPLLWRPFNSDYFQQVPIPIIYIGAGY